MRRDAHPFVYPDTSTKPIMLKQSLYLLIFLLASSIGAAPAAPPTTPTDICIEHSEGIQCAASSNSSAANVSSSQSGVFPGTNLKFRPGIVVDTSEENPSPSLMESKWQALFTTSPNRKASYRPPGVYGGIVFPLRMWRYYTNQNIRPSNPANHTDPGYDWSLLDAAFKINAVQNEGALLVLNLGVVSWGNSPSTPAWLNAAPYDAVWSTDGTSHWVPKFYRYSGPDARGLRNRGTAPYVIDEILIFVKAMYDHLVATGNINKVMFIRCPEAEPSGNLPSDYNSTDYYHGMSLLNRKIAEIYAASGIYVTQSTLVGGGLDIRWQYMNNPHMGANFPDMKMVGTDNFTSATRFNDLNGVYQKDIRFLSQATESNGQRETTFFAAGIPNPWNYSNVTVPQTFSHIVWALSGSPKATDPAKRNSGLGRAGEDPPGIMPVHNLAVSWDTPWHNNPPTLEEVHQALDTFGPPGTFAFPYLPPGYEP